MLLSIYFFCSKNILDDLHWKSWQTSNVLVTKIFSFQHGDQNGLRLDNYMYHNLCYMTEADRTKLTREEKHHVYVKWQTQICTTWPSFLFTFRLLFIISTPKLVVSCNFLSIRIIVLSCFCLLIFYCEGFSTWIWRMPFAVYFSNSSIIHKENIKLMFNECLEIRWKTAHFYILNFSW